MALGQGEGAFCVQFLNLKMSEDLDIKDEKTSLRSVRFTVKIHVDLKIQIFKLKSSGLIPMRSEIIKVKYRSMQKIILVFICMFRRGSGDLFQAFLLLFSIFHRESTIVFTAWAPTPAKTIDF